MKLARFASLVGLCLILAVLCGCASSGFTPQPASMHPIPTAAPNAAPPAAAPLQKEVPPPSLPIANFESAATGVAPVAMLTPATGQAVCAFVRVPDGVQGALLRVYQPLGKDMGSQVNEVALASGNVLFVSEGPTLNIVGMTLTWVQIAGTGTVEQCFAWARSRAGSSVRAGDEIHFYHALPDGVLKEVNVHDDRG